MLAPTAQATRACADAAGAASRALAEAETKAQDLASERRVAEEEHALALTKVPGREQELKSFFSNAISNKKS